MKLIRLEQIIKDAKAPNGYRYEDCLINPENIATVAADTQLKKTQGGLAIIGETQMETITLLDFRGGQMRGMAVTQTLDEIEKLVNQA